MTDLERSVMLSVDVATDQELATVHEALSRAAVGYVLDGLDARVHVLIEDDDEGDEDTPSDPTLTLRGEA